MSKVTGTWYRDKAREINQKLFSFSKAKKLCDIIKNETDYMALSGMVGAARDMIKNGHFTGFEKQMIEKTIKSKTKL